MTVNKWRPDNWDTIKEGLLKGHASGGEYDQALEVGADAMWMAIAETPGLKITLDYKGENRRTSR